MGRYGRLWVLMAVSPERMAALGGGMEETMIPKAEPRKPRRAAGPPMTRERLRSYQKLKREVRWLKEQQQELTQVTDQVKGSMTEFPYTEQTIHISGPDPEELRACQGRIERLHAEMRRVERFVAGLDDGMMRTTLDLHYLRGMTWVRTGIALHVTAESLRKGSERFLDSLGE